MQLNKIPQVYEVSITCKRDFTMHEEGEHLLIDAFSFIFFKRTVNNLFNTVTYNLYFPDMISQTNFIKLIPKNHYSFTLHGLAYFDYLPYDNSLEDYVNG